MLREGGRLHELQSLSFGLFLALWVPTRLCRPALAALRAANIRALSYIDDFASALPGPAPASTASTTAGRAATLQIFFDIRLQVSRDRGTATGAQSHPLLGFGLDTRRHLLLLPPSRLAKVPHASRQLLHHAAHHCRWVLFSRRRRSCGLDVLTLQAMPLAHFHLRVLYEAFRGVAPRPDARLDAQNLRDLQSWHTLSSIDSVGWTRRAMNLTRHPS